MATVDILVPHYNDPEGLTLSLRSVVRQKWVGDKRIVIADDGSSLDHRRSVEAIADDFRAMSTEERPLEIDVIQNPENRGRPFTRNVLLDAIDSKYASWLDAGDEWYPRKLSSQIDLLNGMESSHISRPVWATCNYDWAWNGGRRRKIVQKTDQDQHKALLIGSSLRAYLWTLLGTAESFRCVGWFDERLPRMQDLDYFIRFVSHGGIIRTVKGQNPYCIYHKSDVGRNAEEIRACNALIYDKHRVIFNRYGEQFIRMRLYNMDMLAARFAQNNRDKAKQRRYMWSAFKERPVPFLMHVKKKGFVA
ncbi:MAG: glycosyltransferase family 2 protein [Proteobacteria bacterium]|jgi:glycosyltransferase involved in cell wall biosynthesis|nr:MAG: glycosyltransferase family 2 protein [Pseudomonadota bacterium]